MSTAHQAPTTDNCPECGASLSLNGQPTTPTVDPSAGDGYRFLAYGEVIREGDEYLDGQMWLPSGCWGLELRGTDRQYRRRVPTAPQPEPEPGFRILGSEDVLDADDHYWSPWAQDWSSGTSFAGRTVAQALQAIPRGAAYARRVAPPAAQAPGQLVEVLGGVPWCRAPHGEWVRDFSRPLLVGDERYRTVTRMFGVEDGDCVLLDDGYDYPASALQAVQAKWRPWLPEEALGQKIKHTSKFAARLTLLTRVEGDGVWLATTDLQGWVFQSYQNLLDNYEQLDGSPCGVLEGYTAI